MAADGNFATPCLLSPSRRAGPHSGEFDTCADALQRAMTFGTVQTV
jgi:hypothetical protein